MGEANERTKLTNFNVIAILAVAGGRSSLIPVVWVGNVCLGVGTE